MKSSWTNIENARAVGSRSSQGLARTAAKFLSELLRLRSGERLLIYFDEGSDASVVTALRAAANAMGAHSEELDLCGASCFDERASRLSAKLDSSRYDAICELSRQYLYQSTAWRTARDAGTRIYSLTGLDAAGLVRCVRSIDHQEMWEFGVALRALLKGTRHLRVHAASGTDLRLQLAESRFSRLTSKLRGRRRGKVLRPTGILGQGAGSTFLGGQISIVPASNTVEGVAVIDGHLAPPFEVGALSEPIALSISRSRVIGIDGRSAEAERIRRWFQGQRVAVEHLCLGFHPRALLSESILEAERAFGCIAIGIGQGAFHSDGVMVRPSIDTEDGSLLKSGSYVRGLLPRLERSLRSEGEVA
jgi:leucyl aminopeptidase (aminopeptidase T)